MTWLLVIGGLALAAAGLVCGIALARKAPTILTPDGRRAWSFAAIVGGCMVFTVFAAVGVWLVRGHELYALILALAAHLQILVGMTALGWALGRRATVEVTKSGAKVSDQEATATATVTAQVSAPGGES